MIDYFGEERSSQNNPSDKSRKRTI